MRAIVDRDGCIGCGMCEQTAPEIFSLRSGKSEVLCDEVPPHCYEQTEQAATQCPVLVIHLED